MSIFKNKRNIIIAAVVAGAILAILFFFGVDTGRGFN
jgi:hypothetical protein